jgi:hypothetical protein
MALIVVDRPCGLDPSPTVEAHTWD